MRHLFISTLTLFLLISFHLSIHAQSIPATKVESIDWQSTSFQDLEVLRVKLENVQVVMLGEQTHFDGATFDAKVRLIRFLTQEMGFDMLAFESEFYGMDKANKEIKEEGKKAECLQKTLFPMWTEADMFDDLLSITQNSPNIDFAGFDNQVYSEYNQEALTDELKATLKKNGIALSSKTWNDFTELLYNLISMDNKALISENEVKAYYRDCLNQIQNSIQKLPQEKKGYWSLIIQNIESSVETARSDIRSDIATSMATRDRQMAQNLIYLIENNPNRKIICWGASYHFANQLKQLEITQITKEYIEKDSTADVEEVLSELEIMQNSQPMGQSIKEKYGNKVYSIAFTAYNGKISSYESSQEIPSAPSNSIEYTLTNNGFEYAFIHLADLKDMPAIHSSPLGYLPLKHKWHKAFDGLFFTKTMYPSITNKSTEDTEIEEVIENEKGISSNKTFIINGKLTNIQNGKPIEFANMGIVGTSIGTYTNMNGDFKLSIPSSHQNSSLQVSAIGYKTILLPIDSLRQLSGKILFKLLPENKMLEEVVISAKPLTAKSILKNAHQNISENYCQSDFSMDIFHRSKSYKNDTLRYKLETLIGFYDKDGLQRMPWQKGLKTVSSKLLQIRYTPENLNTQYLVGKLWTIWGHDPVFTKDNVLGPLRMNNYNLKLKGVKPYVDTYVYEIQFECKRPNSYNIGYFSADKFNGTLFIDTESYAILEFKGVMTKEKKYDADKWGNEERETIETTTLEYKYRKHNGKYLLSYARSHIQGTVYYPLSNRSYEYISFDEVMIKNINTENPQILKRPIINMKSNVSYRPEFWEKYNLILDTE